MSNRTGSLAALVAIAMTMLAGCATNSSQVRLRSAQDLDCDAANVHVELTRRPRRSYALRGERLWRESIV